MGQTYHFVIYDFLFTQIGGIEPNGTRTAFASADFD